MHTLERVTHSAAAVAAKGNYVSEPKCLDPTV